MSLVAAIKSVFSLRGVSLELREVGDTVRPGSELRATLRMDVGEYPAQVDALHVYVDEERLIYNVPGRCGFEFWRKVAGLSVPLPRREFMPGESLRVPFALAMPPALEPSEAHRRYRLVARVGGLGFGPTAATVVTVAA